ncbi:MAG: hypothetical protein QM662_11570 [Gordonia sp. (in: high G+C Gram-positive bacteria)]
MPPIDTVWRDAWSTLPDDVHEVLSTRSGTGWFPTARVVRSLFPTVFGSDIPAELALPARLRSRRHITSGKSIAVLDLSRTEDEHVAAIRAAVAHQAPRLERTARAIRALEDAATGAGMGVTDKREALLKLAWTESAAAAPLADDAVRQVITRYGTAPYVDGLRRLLDSRPGLRNELAQLRADHPVPAKPPKDVDRYLVRAYPILCAFLDDPCLGSPARLRAADPTDPVDAETGRRWDAVYELDPGYWEWRTEAMGLSTASPPPPAPIRIADEPRRPDGTRPLWLDSSIERRLISVLRYPHEQRARLPDEEQLLRAEVQRSCQQLGVRSHAARLLLVLGAVVFTMLDDRAPGEVVRVGGIALPDTALAAGVRTHVAKWRRARETTARSARTPNAVTTHVDPSGRYLPELCKRVHGHDVLGVADYTATQAYDLLSGIARTVTERIDAMPTTPLPSAPDVSAADELRMSVAEVTAIRAVAGAALGELVTRALPDRSAITEQDRANWQAWTTAAGSSLTLDAFLDWLDDNGFY